jgi:hypothetical protein
MPSNKITPKEELNDIMVEMFGMIEDLAINEGTYLQFADMFKRMNLNINRLVEMKTIIQQNVYYTNHIRPSTRRERRQPVSEAAKAKSSSYTLCNCGRYISIDPKWYNLHLNTRVHYQGRRNRKYARGIHKTEDDINFEIGREVFLLQFINTHLEKYETQEEERRQVEENNSN